MFNLLGKFATRYRYGIILAWVVVAVFLNAIAPPLEDVSTTDQKDFLPSDAPFARAQAVYEETFPEMFGPSSTILLVDAGAGNSVRDSAVWTWIGEAEAWLNSEAAPENIDHVMAPTTDPEFADALISPDGQVALINIALTTSTDSVPSVEAVETIDEWLSEAVPASFDVYQTGEAALNAQSEEATFTTMDRTIVITFALVIVALLVIYRSPVSPLIPLFSVTMAFLVTIGLLANLADVGAITVVAQVNAILVVVMYGAGTDYCLFLISRFREEMADGIGIEAATKNTVRLVGEAITTSAGTIIVGFVSLLFAEMGMFRSAGPMLAAGIAISLLAGLTLTPALLATLGNRAFWPFKASHRSPGKFYGMTSQFVSSRPLVAIAIIIAVMLPFSVIGLGQELNFDMVDELPDDIDAVRGYDVLGQHMGAGNLFPMTVVVTDRDAETVPQEIVQLTNELYALDNVVDVRGLNTPLGYADKGINNLLRVDGQLRALLAMDDGDDSGDPQAAIEGIKHYVGLLELSFPEIQDDENLATIQQIVDAGIIAIGLRQNELLDAVEGLAARFETIDSATMLPPTGEGSLFAGLQPLVDSYLANNGTAYRLEVVMGDPLGEGFGDTVEAIRDVIEPYNGVASGFSAVLADTQDVLARDQNRVYAVVLAGIYVMLSLMLRSLVAPLYLIGTVVLSYTCTMGITAIFFDVVFGVDKFSWLLPIFMFIFLVGLGIDYSIYLFSRIREEVGNHGIREGVHVAVAATGAIITSAGIILSGTFAGMMAGELLFLSQLGFAVSVGVLIDAFVVRTMLDPALATFFGKWTWWPGGVPGKVKRETIEDYQPVVQGGD